MNAEANRIEFSIAVAAYNVGQYLTQCIDSILPQMDGRMELILVDDGSADDSGAICDRYAAQDARVLAVHQPNGGLPAARNAAIERARGRWIVFVDGDDRLFPGAMQTMQRWKDETAELVIYDYVEFSGARRPTYQPRHGAFVLTAGAALTGFRASILHSQPELKEQLRGIQCMISWGRMWRMDYLRAHRLRFDPAVRRSEDVVFAFRASRGMTRIRIVDECVYEYRRNSVSITRKFEPDTLRLYSVLTDTLRQDMTAHGEDADPLLRKAYYELCVFGVEQSLRQAVTHVDCPWNRRARLAWLRELSRTAWAQEAQTHLAECGTVSRELALTLSWLRRGRFARLDALCRAKRLLKAARRALRRVTA